MKIHTKGFRAVYTLILRHLGTKGVWYRVDNLAHSIIQIFGKGGPTFLVPG